MMNTEELGRVILLCLLLMFVAIADIVFYILAGYSMQRLAKRQKLLQSWLAWIPVARYWILGRISESYLPGFQRWLKWTMPALGICSSFIFVLDVRRQLLSPTATELSEALFLKLWVGSIPHVIVQVLLLLASVWSIYQILFVLRWKQAPLCAAICIPLGFLRWIFLWAAARQAPAGKQEPLQNPQTVQQWLQEMEQVMQEKEQRR